MVYNYTRPRAPIAAMYSSPGPCYALPSLIGQPQHDPRSVHTRAPAYQFGIQHHSSAGNVGPGPCKYYPDTKIYRNGRDGNPRYSLYGRRKDLMPFNTPGAGTYAPERATNHTKQKLPSYSFGTTFAPLPIDETPAPNVYTPPPMLGKTIVSDKRQAPSYSIYGRSKVGGFHEDYAKTPGPGTYQAISPNQYKRKQPQFSLTGRNMMPGDPTQKPGPGAHCPELVSAHEKRTPSFSFGIRHSDYEAPLIVTAD
jgi:hypothetical protein